MGLDCEAAGVAPRGEAFRVPAALRARPRVRDGSREAGGGKGAVFGAMRRGSGGGLVPVRSGGMDGEVAWPRPSEDSSRGAMGRTSATLVEFMIFHVSASSGKFHGLYHHSERAACCKTYPL